MSKGVLGVVLNGMSKEVYRALCGLLAFYRVAVVVLKAVSLQRPLRVN